MYALIQISNECNIRMQNQMVYQLTKIVRHNVSS